VCLFCSLGIDEIKEEEQRPKKKNTSKKVARVSVAPRVGVRASNRIRNAPEALQGEPDWRPTQHVKKEKRDFEVTLSIASQSY